MTNKYEKLAAEIINEVESTIRQANPEVEAMASEKEGNTLLYGQAYYDLENYIASVLEERQRV